MPCQFTNKPYGIQRKYAGFINHGAVTPEDPYTLASEAHLFLLGGTRTHWKCPIGYFLCDKISATFQAQLVRMALEKAGEAGLQVWSITADGTSVNITTFRQLDCTFGTTYESMITKFKHPSKDYYVYVRCTRSLPYVKNNKECSCKPLPFSHFNGETIKWKFF